MKIMCCKKLEDNMRLTSYVLVVISFFFTEINYEINGLSFFAKMYAIKWFRYFSKRIGFIMFMVVINVLNVCFNVIIIAVVV